MAESFPNSDEFDPTDPALIAAQDQLDAGVIEQRRAFLTGTPADVVEIANRGVAFQAKQAAARFKPEN